MNSPLIVMALLATWLAALAPLARSSESALTPQAPCVGPALTPLAPAAGSRASVLSGVAALEMPVTLAESKIPLGELVARIAAATGVPLAATREVADEPVLVAVREFSARELLEQVAELLDYRWSRRGPEGDARYEIGQDLAAKQREEALRRAVYVETLARFRQEIARYAEVAALSPAEIQTLQAAPPARAARAGVGASLSPPRGGGWGEGYAEIARRLASPVPRALAALLGRLPASDWALLEERGQLLLATTPQPGERPLPAEAARAFRSAVPTIFLPGVRWTFDDPAEGERMRQNEQTMREQWRAASDFRVTLRLNAACFQTGGALSLNAEVRPARPGGSGPSAAPPPPFLGGTATRLDLSVEAAGPRLPKREETPGRRAALAKDPVLGAKRPFPPGSGHGGAPAPSARREAPAPGSDAASRLQALLPEIARVYEVPIVADAYWSLSAPSGAPAVRAQPTPLFEVLDRLTGSGMEWDRRGAVIRLRSRTWFLERPREVPLRLVRRWQVLCERQGALPIEECATVAATLNDGQVESLGGIATRVGLPPDFLYLATAREALRLYETLSPAQRQALWQEKAIPLARMTRRQQVLFVAALPERVRAGTDPLGPVDLSVAHLSLGAEAQVRVREERAGVITYRTHPAAPGARPEGLRENVARAAGGGPESRSLDPPSPPRRASEEAPVVTRHAVTRVMFYLQYGPEVEEVYPLLVASPR